MADLASYIRQQLQAGYDINAIRTALVKYGYPQADIDAAIRQAYAVPQPTYPQPAEVKHVIHLSPTVIIAIVAVFVVAIGGLVIPIINTIYLTTMQLNVPVDKMGRISSIDYALSMAISPIATIVAGPLAELLGVPNLIFYCSIIGIIITFIVWWMTYLRIKNNGSKEFEINDLNVDSTQTEL